MVRLFSHVPSFGGHCCPSASRPVPADDDSSSVSSGLIQPSSFSSIFTCTSDGISGLSGGGNTVLCCTDWRDSHVCRPATSLLHQPFEYGEFLIRHVAVLCPIASVEFTVPCAISLIKRFARRLNLSSSGIFFSSSSERFLISTTPVGNVFFTHVPRRSLSPSLVSLSLLYSASSAPALGSRSSGRSCARSRHSFCPPSGDASPSAILLILGPTSTSYIKKHYLAGSLVRERNPLSLSVFRRLGTQGIYGMV